MGLFIVPYSTDPTAFDVQLIAADNAAKMQELVNAALQAAPQTLAGVDINLSGTGSGPNWLCSIVMSSNPDPNTNATQLADSEVFVVEASNPVEARLRLDQVLAAASPTPLTVNKVEIAGGGIGTIFMALAYVQAALPPPS